MSPRGEYSGTQIAKRVCELSDWSISNLALQKMLYLVQLFYMGQNEGRPLIFNDFEAWDYGPVLPKVYQRAKVFGSKPVRNIFHSVAAKFDAATDAFLREAIDALKDEEPGDLVAITHRTDGAWDRNYVRGSRGVVIPKADILQEYNEFYGDD